MQEKLLKILNKVKDWFERDYFWGEKSIQIIVAINFVLNLSIWILVIVKSTSTEIPLASNISQSARFLTPQGKEIFILPIIGFLVFIVNIFFARETYQRENFLSFMLLGISLFIQVIILVTIMIYLLV